MTTTPDTAAAPSGLDLIRRLQHRDGDGAAFIGRLLDMSFDEVEEGRVVISLTTRPDFANPLGAVHGGIAATLLDSVMGCAVHTTLPAGTGYTTLELKVNYIRAAHTAGQTLIATGTTVHVGRRTATAEGRVHDEDGRLVAHATTTCLILPAP
ncbi:PaaI family thioesterase [Streptomyces sp. LP11]|uniref:PaaI family thioesterase n=1 Tax=Streptomyces pyxinicus TaxID=2970331 RepID=A0ABT2AYV1_9ACTN|nr:PaaI family thioesterase [Streptomyces sp. LP11]MCS0601405.1 PaaI family thioesterase [Streptomyces sp. LP11]